MRREAQLKKLKEAKALLKKAITKLKNYDSVLCSELFHAPEAIDESIKLINLYADKKTKGE